ncbi:MAG: electron transfer flavoprotein subunit beta/FixA family protein [Clostridia bacterium]|nr:electron transfer flavoprotein subunit beta/FixA family protein [Clostridia bacterium]
MNIVVCIKQVPDTSEVRLDPKTNTLIRDGVPSIINPDDKAGLEAALRIRDRMGKKCRVVVLSMGPAQADLALKEALAMGADKAILLSDRAFGGADTWATSTTLAAALHKIPFDLIITGRQAIDGDTAQVGPQIAEHLGLPHVSYASRVEIIGDSVAVHRQFDDRYHSISVKMPCLITALSDIAAPRYMTPGGVFSAFRESTVEVWTLADIEVDKANIGLSGSPTRVIRSYTRQGRGAGEKVELSPAESAEFVIGKLRERHVL